MYALDDTDNRTALVHPQSMQDVFFFFGLTFLLTTPFWVISAASGRQLMPGLPVAALAVICPAAAGIFLSWRLGGMAAGRSLLMRTIDVRRIKPKAWWLAILLTSPTVSAAAFVILRFNGSGIPDPQIDILTVVALFVVFLVGALSEEMGWTGFALDPIQAQWGALPAALLIGVVWAVWHYPALLEAHRSVGWIAWWTLGTISLRVFMVWLFNKTGGSVFAVAMVHAVSNLCWQLFPVHGTWFDPRLNGLITAGVALVVIPLMIHRRGRDGPRARKPS